jgi:hypothetical protein
LLFAAAVIIAFLIIWSRVRFIVIVPLQVGGFLLLTGGLILVIYIVLRMLFRR